ncbi:hypothetical protein L7F22_059554 [Adiantum nelumboides]|nr:hypothetical protein [Adiantum nelumboides]
MHGDTNWKYVIDVAPRATRVLQSTQELSTIDDVNRILNDNDDDTSEEGGSFSDAKLEYPKDSEKAMLARLTGLSRNQVSNWFINARVRLWKPMIEEMYIEEGKALEMAQAGGGGTSCSGGEEDAQGAEAGCVNNNSCSGGDDIESNAYNGSAGGGSSILMALRDQEAAAAHHHLHQQQQRQQLHQAGAAADQYYNMQRSDGSLLSSWPQQPTHHHYNTHNDLHSFIHFHSSAARATEPASQLPDPSPAPSQAFSWMKPHVPPASLSAHDGDIANILTHHHHPLHPHQLSSNMPTLLQQQQGHAASGGGGAHHNQLSSTTSSFMKNGVSLTLGLQQPPPHSAPTYNSTPSHGYHVRPSEALLF